MIIESRRQVGMSSMLFIADEIADESIYEIDETVMNILNSGYNQNKPPRLNSGSEKSRNEHD